MSTEEERDINNLFKFNVGDKVIKRWRWSKERRDRFGPQNTLPMGSIGTIKEIRPDGTIVVSFYGRGPAWSLGASELDFAPPDSLPSASANSVETTLPLPEVLGFPALCVVRCSEHDIVCTCTLSHAHLGVSAIEGTTSFHHHPVQSEEHKWI